jgi:hypothetical protein
MCMQMCPVQRLSGSCIIWSDSPSPVRSKRRPLVCKLTCPKQMANSFNLKLSLNSAEEDEVDADGEDVKVVVKVNIVTEHR